MKDNVWDIPWILIFPSWQVAREELRVGRRQTKIIPTQSKPENNFYRHSPQIFEIFPDIISLKNLKVLTFWIHWSWWRLLFQVNTSSPSIKKSLLNWSLTHRSNKTKIGHWVSKFWMWLNAMVKTNFWVWVLKASLSIWAWH